MVGFDARSDLTFSEKAADSARNSYLSPSSPPIAWAAAHPQCAVSATS